VPAGVPGSNNESNVSRVFQPTSDLFQHRARRVVELVYHVSGLATTSVRRRRVGNFAPSSRGRNLLFDKRWLPRVSSKRAFATRIVVEAALTIARDANASARPMRGAPGPAPHHESFAVANPGFTLS